MTNEWIERDAAVVWHGFTQMSCYTDNSPVIVERAEGRELVDVDGKRYFDAISSLWVNTLGHRVPELDQAIRDQLDKVAHSTLLGNGNRTTIEFAEALARVVPVERPHVLFASDGAAAVEQGLRIAFQHWTNKGISNRTHYLALGDAYHGDTIGSLSLGDGGFGTNVFDPLRFPVVRTPGYADPKWLQTALDALELHAPTLAAAVIEPMVQGAAGMQIADPEDVNTFGEACRSLGVPLLVDEVAVGFGRTGTLFASEQCGLHPDILCLGKGITGGYLPMSATVVSQGIFDAFDGPDLSDRTLYHGHSYGGNALAAAVALRHLQLIEEWNVLGNVEARAEQLADELERRVATLPVSMEVRVAGLMAGVELHPSVDGLRLGRRVSAAAVHRGVLLRPIGDVVLIVPPLTSTAEEITRIVDALVGAIEEVCLHGAS